MDTSKALEIASDLAYQVGNLLAEGWGHSVDISYKGDVNLHTEYDSKAEELIVKGLLHAFPDHAVLGEEGGVHGNPESVNVWIVDPLDGTTNFAHGFPVFAISIALEINHELSVGLVFDPLRNELFSARRGHGALLNGAAISVSQTNGLDSSLLATGFAYDRRTAEDNNIDNLARFVRLSQGIRRAGAAALDLAYVACGRLDGFWETGLHTWDVAAGILLAIESGGSASTYSGAHLDHRHPKQIIVSNGFIHSEMVTVLSS